MSVPTDTASLTDVLAAMCWTVSVVTTQHADTPRGTTMNAVMPVSDDPPLAVVALKPDSEILAAIRATGLFGINVLGSEQAGLGLGFATKEHAARFDGVDWALEAGVPRIAGASAFAACRVTQIIETGDRLLVLGEAVRADGVEQAPLTFYRRTFGTHIAPTPT